ncbi:MAG: 4Fe-4S binding protein [Planctomycetota bacterium]|jgi:polyferredoxin
MALNDKINRCFTKLIPYRTYIQATFLLLWLDPFVWRLHGICGPVFHCHSCPLALFACPIGVLANFSALHLFPFVALGILVVIGVLLGAVVCGWLCPFGLLQDLLANIPTPKFNPPAWTGYGRYVILIGTVFLIPYFFGESHPLFFCRICPAGAIEAAMPNMVKQAIAGQSVAWPNALKLIILILFLIAILFVKRPFCRMMCPLGAIFGIFNRVSAFFVKLDGEKCNSCAKCSKLCIYGVEPYKTPNNDLCIRCLECTKCDAEAITIGTPLD